MSRRDLIAGGLRATPMIAVAGVLLGFGLVDIAALPQPALSLLAAGGAFAVLGGSAEALARRAGPVQEAAVGLGALVLAVVAGVTIGLAVAAERQNYWDAVRFSQLLWLAGLAVVAAVVLLRRSWAPQRDWLWVPLWLSYTAGGALLLVWIWTWFEPAQELASWLARWLWRLTHA